MKKLITLTIVIALISLVGCTNRNRVNPLIAESIAEYKDILPKEAYNYFISLELLNLTAESFDTEGKNLDLSKSAFVDSYNTKNLEPDGTVKYNETEDEENKTITYSGKWYLINENTLARLINIDEDNQSIYVYHRYNYNETYIDLVEADGDILIGIDIKTIKNPVETELTEESILGKWFIAGHVLDFKENNIVINDDKEYSWKLYEGLLEYGESSDSLQLFYESKCYKCDNGFTFLMLNETFNPDNDAEFVVNALWKFNKN